MSKFFIGRPNFAWVVAIFITLAGLLAIPSLPVSQFPVVAPPQVSIFATYPGASASTLVDSVTSVIEEELSGAKGLLYFESSSSSNGTAEVTGAGTKWAITNPQIESNGAVNVWGKYEHELFMRRRCYLKSI